MQTETQTTETPAAATPAIVRWTVTGYEIREAIPLGGGQFHPNLSSCERCGQDIRIVVSLKSTTGQTLKTGTDCAVTLEGGPELAEIRRAERVWRSEQTSAKRAGVAAALAAARAETAARAIVEHAELLAALDAIVASDSIGDFDRDFASGLADNYRAGRIDRAPSDAIADRVARLQVLAALPPSRALVGGKVRARVVFERRASFSTKFGPKSVLVFRTLPGVVVVDGVASQTDGGQILVWYTASSPEQLRTDQEARGTILTVEATIKGRREYEGIVQTEITRAKIESTGSGWFYGVGADDLFATQWYRTAADAAIAMPQAKVVGPFSSYSASSEALDADPDAAAVYASWDQTKN